MKKYLVTIELRYSDVQCDECTSASKVVTIGVYDTQDESIVRGNKALENIEKRFPLNPHYNVKERFSKNGGCFGEFKNTISDLGWIKTPFRLFAKITVLDYKNIDDAIINAIEACNRYKEYKNNEE